MLNIRNAFIKLTFPILFLILSSIMEIISFFILGLGGLPEYFLYDFAILLLISAIIYVIPNKTAQFIICLILFLLQNLLTYVNYSLITLYGDVLSIEMILLFGDAMLAMDSGFTFVKIAILLSTMMLLTSSN